MDTGYVSESEAFGWSFVFEWQLTPEANEKVSPHTFTAGFVFTDG